MHSMYPEGLGKLVAIQAVGALCVWAVVIGMVAFAVKWVIS